MSLTVGARIKEYRTFHNLTQKELSQKLGLTPKMISFYENNERIPPIDIIVKLTKIFNTTSDYLLGISSTSPTALQTPELTGAETKLLEVFRTLSDDNKIRATARLLDLQEQQSFTRTRGRQAPKSSNFQKTKKADKIS